MTVGLRVMNYVVVIPARYKSTRLPGKPLIPIAGVPMIERTYRQCIKSVSPEQVIVATDDERIASHCKSIGARVLMTPEECETGTDRVACLLDIVDADVFINVQGDEPILSPADLSKMVLEVEKGKYDVINGFSKITDENQFFSRTVPKVVMDKEDMLLYMSRGSVPHNKEGTFVKAYRQICIYGFSREALSFFGQNKQKTPLESIEDIEILRLVENKVPVKMIELSGDSLAVDVPDDVNRVEAFLAEAEKIKKLKIRL